MIKWVLSVVCFLAVNLGALGREVIPANDGWRFFAGDPDGAELPGYADSGWLEVSVPHDFQISQPWVEPAPDEKPDNDNPMANIRSRLSARAFKEMGVGWYRKHFHAPSDWKEKRVVVDFEGILLTGDVFLNGKRIGGTDYGYLGFESDISDLLNIGGENVLAVRADTGKPDNSRWYTGAGLYRDVNFIITSKDRYFMRHPLQITTPDVSASNAAVIVAGEVFNNVKCDSISVGIEIVSPTGDKLYERISRHKTHPRQKAREYMFDSIMIEKPLLWDTESPNLYTVTVSLLNDDGEVVDSVDERFGIRKVEFSPEYGMKLNGRKILLKGIANHHTLGALGAAAYPAAMEKRLMMLKDFGFNHVRTSHNPYSKSFLDLCDKHGILVVDELYDKWTTQYAGGRKPWTEQWQHDVTEWVRRDRNHPSVVIWSLGNELQLIPDLPFNDWGVTPYRLQKTLLNRYDTTRPVTVAMHPRGRNELTDSLPAPLAMVTDIASYNYRYMYFPGDSRRFPNMMFYQSEANTSGMGPNFYDMDLDKVLGLAYWGMIDYFGESAGWPAKGWTQGVFDVSLEPKPMAYFLRSIFKPEEPIVRISVIDDENSLMWNDVQVGVKSMSSHWNRKEGADIKLYTFTNAEEVELLVNGKSLGRKYNNIADSKSRNRILWEKVPYASGKIEARAYSGGKKVASHLLKTAGKGIKLIAEGDNNAWKADGRDLQHVRVTAVDKKGIRDHSAHQTVNFKVNGPAQIIGVINGDMYSGEALTGNMRSLYNGSCVVILKSMNNATGERASRKVRLSAEAEGLDAAEIEFELFY